MQKRPLEQPSRRLVRGVSWTRREFLVGAALAASGLIVPRALAEERRHWWKERAPPPSPVAVVRTDDRAAGIRQAIKLLEIESVTGKDVLLIPDLESKAPYPMTTHPDALLHVSRALWDLRAESVTIGAQSSTSPTRDVLTANGLYDRLEQIEARLLNIEDLGFNEWIKIQSSGGQWRKGFHLARPVLQSACVVTTCGLRVTAKGDLGMSLWLGTNLLPKRDVLDRVELAHANHPGRLIAELNQGYRPSLIVVDGMEAALPRVHRGARLILAGTDRVAVDAVGAAALKLLGADLGGKIFEMEQIAWALILRVGINRPSQIKLVAAADAESQAFVGELGGQLANG